MATDYYYTNKVYKNRSDYERKKIIKKTQKIKAKRNIKSLTLLTVILLMIFMLICLYGKLMESKYELNSAKNQLENLKVENSSLRADISKELDLKQLKIYAQDELGMISPNENQIVFMNFSLNDKTIACEFDAQENTTVDFLLSIFN